MRKGSKAWKTLACYCWSYFPKTATRIFPIPQVLTMWHCHTACWELGSVSSLFAPGQVRDYGERYVTRFLRLGPNRQRGFCLDLLGWSLLKPAAMLWGNQAGMSSVTAKKSAGSPSHLPDLRQGKTWRRLQLQTIAGWNSMIHSV